MKLSLSKSFACASRSFACVAALVAPVFAAAAAPPSANPAPAAAPAAGPFKPEAFASNGTVTVGGRKIAYQAVAGTLVVHPRGWDDVAAETAAKTDHAKNPTAVASMFYVAYFKTGGGPRPITFLYNGGPGSASLWLHMGAFGPRRVITATDSHTPAAPYRVVDNAYSLLDVSDLVFIDAPGTGFSRVAGEHPAKAFYGVDQDAYAFGEFIKQFLTKYHRWNSPKYLFGESYGTTRSAVLINDLESQDAIDFNGVILLSQIFGFDFSPDLPTRNPGLDLPYELALPTYAATAWYHHKLPREAGALEPFLAEVEKFAMGDYAQALAAGSDLDTATRNAIAAKLHDYTGLPVAYILRADLRIDGGEFRQRLQLDEDLATGRLDTRFSGPALDPMSQRAEYDPQASALASAYVSAFNDYVRTDLHFDDHLAFKPMIPLYMTWDFAHRQPGQPAHVLQGRSGANVMPDLANAMKLDPNLQVQLNSGYFDLATPFFEGMYEMHHLPMPADLQRNIEIHHYQSGHMVYAKESSLAELHRNVAAFIERTDRLSP
ncbi:MAG: peptidase S10 [Gammaproteobacteria bacterium]|nr:peptidase S10 [Gammaproteobacteria bacterium]